MNKTPTPQKQFSELETHVMFHKGTERAFTGEYTDTTLPGTYVCKNCGSQLYKSEDKFHSGCGWPSFDDEINGAVTRQVDADGRRTEILCANCGIHLGHVFTGEGFTEKNTRHCVNSISMEFIPDEKQAKPTQEHAELIVGCGCFWGVQYWFDTKDGVISTEVGYAGGDTKNPTYEEVCRGNSGHKEVLKVRYNPSIISFEDLIKYFFEIHDFSQENGQGNDIGDQYLSVIYYTTEEEKQSINAVIDILKNKGKKVATQVLPFKNYYAAEGYHQKYYAKNGKSPYCHFYNKIF